MPLLGATGILVLDSFVNNIILLGTQRILGKYLVFSSLVLLFSFFYRFASSVSFQTYSHLVIIFVKGRVISLEDISFLKVFTFIILNMFIKFLIRYSCIASFVYYDRLPTLINIEV